jgi:hypothetical protein
LKHLPIKRSLLEDIPLSYNDADLLTASNTVPIPRGAVQGQIQGLISGIPVG